jgi:hypothetical protein
MLTFLAAIGSGTQWACVPKSNHFIKRVDLDDANNDHGDQAFTDREIPSGFAPFNVQEVNGNYLRTVSELSRGRTEKYNPSYFRSL